MRRIISIMLALAIIVSIPVSATAKGADNAMLANSGEIITINQDNTTRKDGTVSKIDERRDTTLAAPANTSFRAEDFDGLSRDEIVELTKGTLPKGGLLELEEKRAHRETNVLADLSEATEPALVSLYEKKQESRQRMLDSIEYGKKLANGEVEATKGNEKFTVVNDVILISTQEELAAIHEQSGYFRLVNDIVMTGEWEPIDFFGVLEGGGYKITGATMQYIEYDFVGFFSSIGPEAVVQNLTLVYPYVYANASAGCFCAYNQGTISNCHVENGTILSYMWTSYDYAFWDISGVYIGGFCGVNEGYIMDSSFTGDVDGWDVCGGMVGENYGYVFACYAMGNICYELNVYDYDVVGADYYAAYGYEEYPLLTTMLRFQWGALILSYCEAVCYGYNGGLIGINYGYALDSCVQGSGSGMSYSQGVVAGFDCVGGLVGADAGYIAHCYSIDKLFPALENGAELYFPWDYCEEGIYYDYEYFLIHESIAWLTEYSVTDASAEVFYYVTTAYFPCADECYHGTLLTADEFLSASTYSNWNNAEWNNGPIWIFMDGYYPIISECPIIPTEWVISYTIGNPGGMLDGTYLVYKLAMVDPATALATEPAPPAATDCPKNWGIAAWTPTAPYLGKDIGSDMTYTAFFGELNAKYGDANLDSHVNSGDAVEILRSCVQLVTLNNQQKLNADVTRDGVVNTADAILVLRYVIGLIDKF